MWRRVEWRKEAVFGESAISEFRFGDAIAFVAVPGDCYDHAMKRWHAWLELARISNLPTVWTNVLAGWLLAGGAWHWPQSGWKAFGGFMFGPPLLWLLVGGSLLYTAGMILNDAFDAKFDREHRKERPIPSGRVSVSLAWSAGIAMLMGGAAMSYFGAGACGWLVLALMAAILLYDVFHKPWAGSVLIMGACRTLLYLVAGSAVAGGLDVHEDGILIIRSIALGGYVIGLSLVARNETKPNPERGVGRWFGGLALGLPLIAGIAVGTISLMAGQPTVVGSAKGWVSLGSFRLGSHQEMAGLVLQLILMILLGALIAVAIRRMRTPPPSNIGRAVGLLLAGIVMVDAIAICPLAPLTSLAFAASLPLLLMWQRKIAAT
jgi:hypothetical protein